MRRHVAALVALLLVSACARPPRPPAPPPPAIPAAGPGTVYRLVPEDSLLTVYAYRAGPLASLGHNHVLVLAGLSGELHLPANPEQVSGDITAQLADFRIDEFAARQAAGADFPGEIAAADVAGTRQNMLGPQLLDAAHFPELHASVLRAHGGPSEYAVTVSLTVRGVASTQDFPAHLTITPQELTAEGEIRLSQRALGLPSFTALMGALSVDDSLRVRYRIVARTAGS
jgi:YceI-like domain